MQPSKLSAAPNRIEREQREKAFQWSVTPVTPKKWISCDVTLVTPAFSVGVTRSGSMNTGCNLCNPCNPKKSITCNENGILPVCTIWQKQ